MVPYLVADAFLLIGLFNGFGGSAMGANAVVGFTKSNLRLGKGSIAGGITDKILKTKTVSGTAKRAFGAASMAIENMDAKYANLGKSGNFAKRLLGTGAKVILAPSVGMAMWAIKRTQLTRKGIEAAAEARQVSLPKNFDLMTANEQAMVARTYGKKDRLRIQAIMQGKGAFEKVTLTGFKEDAIKSANKFAGDPTFKKEFEAIMLKAFPDKLEKEIYMKYKLAGLSGEQLKKKREEIELDMEREHARLEVRGLTAGMSARKAQDFATQVTAMKGLSYSDLKSISEDAVDSKAFRTASIYMDGNHLKAITEKFGYNKTQEVMDKEGGLNDVIKTEADLKKLARDNSGLVRFMFKTEAGMGLNKNFEQFLPDNGDVEKLEEFMKTVATELRDAKDEIRGFATLQDMINTVGAGAITPQRIINDIQVITGFPSGRAFIELNNDEQGVPVEFINHIAREQAAGRWPVV
jgi:hypothetical protein